MIKTVHMSIRTDGENFASIRQAVPEKIEQQNADEHIRDLFRIFLQRPLGQQLPSLAHRPSPTPGSVIPSEWFVLGHPERVVRAP